MLARRFVVKDFHLDRPVQVAIAQHAQGNANSLPLGARILLHAFGPVHVVPRLTTRCVDLFRQLEEWVRFAEHALDVLQILPAQLHSQDAGTLIPADVHEQSASTLTYSL